MSATGFSYAQAARGQSISQAITPPVSSSPGVAPQEMDHATYTGPSTVPQAGPSSIPSASADSSKALVKAAISDTSSSPQKAAADVASPTVSSTLIGTTAESASSFSLDDPSLQIAPNEKSGHVSSPGTRSPSSDDIARKGGRKTRTPKAASKDGEQSSQADDLEKEKEPVKVELSPAPLPTVNVWSQRMIEQAAKAKQNPAAPPPGPTTAATTTAGAMASLPAPNGGTKTRDDKKISSGSADSETSTEPNGFNPSTTKPQPKRLSESARAGSEQPRRSGPRGSRTAEKEEKATAALSRSSLPSVQDATLWPTPESAAVAEELRLKAPAEKPDTADKNGQEEVGTSKSRKKGWLPLPFVPTVNFQTPIPNVRGSKPKTGGRGGRESSSRGGYNGVTNGTASSDKTSFASPGTDKAAFEARDSARESSNAALPSRPASHSSAPSKRFSVDATHTHARESRKPSTTAPPDKAKESGSESPMPTARGEFVPRGNHTSVVNGDNNGHGHNQSSQPAQSERRFISAVRSTDHHSSLAKDHGSHQPKEQHVQASRERTDARGERPGRGGFRGGRGGHSNSAAQSHHVPHQAYQPNGQRVTSGAAYGSNAAALPPTAAAFSPPPQQFSFGNAHSATRPGVRNPARTPSASQTAATFGNRLQNGAANPSRLHGHGAHAATALAADFQMQPYSYSAFNPYMDSELLHGLTLQVEYYFSLDNLCKDVFLRRKMNDQGFVPLAVIARFKRMAELAPSMDFIRAACEQSENLDYVVDQDQNEWIRSRFLWGGFILPPDERDEDARKAGPDLRTALFRSAHHRSHQVYVPAMASAGYPSMAQSMFPTVYPASGSEVLYPPYEQGMQVEHTPAINGSPETNGRLHKGESQLSAAVPDFSPGGLSGAPTTLEDYQTCPDEQVEKLVVLVGSEADGAPAAPANRSRDGPTTDRPSDDSGVNHSSADGRKSLSSGEVPASSAPASSVAQKVGEKPYPELRAKAFEQRRDAKPGETPAGMKHLYQFWTHCLPDKFNVRMYDDFRSSALEDARRDPPNDFGLKCLLRYYNHVLFGAAGARPYPAVFMPHHAEAKLLSDSLRPGANGESRA